MLQIVRSDGSIKHTTIADMANVTGVLSPAHGGTGLDALGSAGQMLRVNAGGDALEYSGDYYTQSAADALLDAKAPLASPTFTGTVTVPTLAVTGAGGFGDRVTITEPSGLSTYALDLVSGFPGVADGTSGLRFLARNAAGANAAISMIRGGRDAAGDTRAAFLAFDTRNSGGTIVEAMHITSGQSVVIGTGALATNATDGFLYIRGGSGAPSGTPTAYSGRYPFYVDASNNRLYIHIAGTWRYAALT